MVEEVFVVIVKLKEVELQLEYVCEREDFERVDVLSEEVKEVEIRLDIVFIVFWVVEVGCDFVVEEF